MISASIITKNEEKNIRRCLESIKWIDDIVVVDSGSTDKTISICEEFNCKIIKTEWLGFGKTKQIGVNNTKNNWVISIDADEERKIEHKEKITEINGTEKTKGYYLKRNSFYLGKLIKYSGWQNDYVLRLFDKRYGEFDNKLVHERILIDESLTKKINIGFFHYPYRNISSHIKKINLYTSIASEELQRTKKINFLVFPFIAGFYKFLKVYFFRMGFLDGKQGLILAIMSSLYVFLKYLKLWLLTNNKKW